MIFTMYNDKNHKEERKEVAAFMRRLYLKGLTTTSGGNISCRISDDTVLITPSATDKGKMKWQDVGIMTIAGENLTPGLKPSIEYEMHLSIYNRKREINAVIHAHPVFASAFTAMKTAIRTDLTAEAKAICGNPLFVPYALMGTKELASLAADNIERSDILLLENHGILTAGALLIEAFDKLEVLENAARMTLIVEMTGKKKPLTRSRVLEIEKLFR